MTPFSSLFDIFKDNTVVAYFLLLGTALLVGLAYSFIYKKIKKGEVYTKYVPVALIILPAAMAALIGLINMRNNEIEAGATALRIGIVVSCGVALTRFRSNGLGMTEMVYIVLATSIGIALGIGYALFAVLTAILFGSVLLIAHRARFGENKEGIYTLKYEVGEDLNNNEAFEEAIAKHCDSYSLKRVKTIEYGQLYEMRYSIVLKKGRTPRDLIDEVRLHNANLNVTVCLEDKD